MARAEVRPVESAMGPCPSCGSQGHRRLQVLTARQRVAWEGCDYCWALAMRRHQLGVLQMICREVDKDVKPGMNPKALMG